MPIAIPPTDLMVRKLELERPLELPDVPKAVDFADRLREFVHHVDALQNEAHAKADGLAKGQHDDLHGTMVMMEQADVSIRLLANVRNRALEAYREIMRMGA